MTVFELEITADDLVEEVEEIGLELDADEIVQEPIPIPVDWDHSKLLNRDAKGSHPWSAIEGADEIKSKLDGVEDGAQVNVIETVEVNSVPLKTTDKTVNIPVPTSYGWTLDLDEAGTIYLKDKSGGVLSKIETGLDRVVKKGYFDEEKVEIVLVLDDDSEIRINASYLVDVYTADGYYLTVSKARVFDITDNVKQILTDSTAHIANTSNPHKVTKAQVGLGNVDNTSDIKKPVSEAVQAALDGKASADDVSLHIANTSNPHKVTKAQVGLGNVDNTADLAKPVSVAQQAALDAKADKEPTEAHIANTSNPHSVTKAQIGLGNADDTADADKPVSKKQQAALDKKADATALSTHTTDTKNPHKVTKAQVGLGNVDNTADADKPVSTATQTALDSKVDKVEGKGLSTMDYTKAEHDKLAGVASGAEVNVIEKITVNGAEVPPTAKTVTLDIPTKASQLANDAGYITKAIGDLTNYYTKTETYTKAEVNTLISGVKWTTAVVDSLPETGQANTIYFVPKAGAGDDTHDEYIWVDGAWELIGSTQITVDVVNGADGITVAGQSLQAATEAHPGLMTVAQVKALGAKAEASTVSAHIASTSNPHKVTKAQIGLDKVDNTSDADKPISAAVQTALDAKADAADVAGLVPETRKINGKALSADITLNASDVGALSADTHIPEGSVVDPDFSETSVNPVQNKIITAKLKELATKTELEAHEGDTSNPHKVTKAQIGLGNVDNTADIDKPVSTAMKKALDAKAASADLTTHTGDTSNPHKVTKAQVGLGNVDNTSDSDKPISTAAQAELDKKALAADLTAHTGNTSNPHSVTKAQVGLGNVDNTSDKSKPISTATQTALDKKVDKVEGKGLSSNDLTDALHTKLSDLYTKAQIDALVAGVQWSVTVVDVLPATGSANTFYFVPKEGSGDDTHDEYIWVDGAWELIGSTQVTIGPASSTQDGLMTKQHVQKLDATAEGLATAQSDIGTIKTGQTTQDTHLSNLDTALEGKVDKVEGKGLSTNDFTAALLTKLNGIATGAQVNIIEKITVNGTAQTVASKTAAITIGKGTVGLGNVDNTSDTDKPISTATQTALDAKGTIYCGTFTGDGTTKTFTLTHGLGSMPAVTLYKGSAMMLTDTEATATTVKFTFNTAPASGTTFTAVLIG